MSGRVLGRALVLVGVASFASAHPGAVAQAHRIGPTLRYGTGLVDVPTATVLPHGVLALTVSGFHSGLNRAPVIDASGEVVGYGEARRAWYGDTSVTLGLYERFEAGLSLQDLGGDWGSLLGGFGRIALLRPENGGIGLAVGARYTAFTGTGPGVPGRLGITDPDLVARPPGREEVDTELTPYVVATGTYQGPRSNLFPAYDVTLTVGLGGGLFDQGGDLPYYAEGDAGGWFLGSAIHVGLGSGRLLSLVAEYNGFDVNAGAVLDLQGLRVGSMVLGLDHGEDVSLYRSRKLGLVASLAVCPGRGGLRCGPERNRLLERPRTEAIVLPAPPPDTVVRVPAPPEGTPVSLCLSTGQEVVVRISAAGDTLVGPGRVSTRAAGGDLVFPGRYAGVRPWYRSGASLEVEGATWEPLEEPVGVRCTDLREWSSLDGVPLFVEVDAGGSPGRLYLPVQPGFWRVYRRRLEPAGATLQGPRLPRR